MPPLPSSALASRALEAQRFANARLAIELGDPVLYAQAVWTIRGDQDTRYRIAGFDFLTEPAQQTARKTVIMASAGCGKTEIFLPKALMSADQGRRVIYAFENDLKTGLLVKERVNPNLQASAYFQKRCYETDNVQYKKFPKGFVYFVGMGKDSSITSIHADDLFLDEFDLMEPDKAAAAEKRLASSEDPRSVYIGNPNLEGAGIHKAYVEGDQRLWNIVCDACGVELPLDFDTHVDLSEATCKCPHCHKAIDRLKPGRWIASNPKGTYPSYYIHALMSPVCDLKAVCAELQSDDVNVVRAAWRFNKGKPFSIKEGGLTDQDLWAADGGDEWTQVAPGGFLVCDPGGLFDVQIYKPARINEPLKCCWYGTVKNFVELEKLILYSQVSSGLIDFGPENKGAEQLCHDMKLHGKDFRRCAYKLPEAPGTANWAYDHTDPLLIAAQRTGALDQMVADLRGGRQLFPRRAVRTSNERFAQHMRAPRREVETNNHGHQRVVWNHDKPDHQFHCSVYGNIWGKVLVASSGHKSRKAGYAGF